MFNFISRPVIISPGNLNGRSLNKAKIIKGDTVLVKARLSGDITGATIAFTGRLFGDPFKTVVIQKTSATASQIQIDDTSPGLYSDITIQIASSDTAALEPDTRIEYDLQVTDDLSYGGAGGDAVVITNAISTLEIGTFTILDQVTV